MVADTGTTIDSSRRVNEVYGRSLLSELELESDWSAEQVNTRDVDRSPRVATLPGTDVTYVQAMSRLANKYVGSHDRSKHAAMYTVLLAEDPEGTGHFVPSATPRFVAAAVDWDRWHKLLDIKAERELTSSEEREYLEFAKIVARLDAEEAAAADAALDRLTEKHQRVLDSIRRLTAAVRAAAERP